MKRFLTLSAVLALVFLAFSGIASFGLVGPDEPRYASVGRAMAASGDWVTPRLWGAPWFEKPALLYWIIAAAFRAGFDADLAPRVPVALLSVGFVLWFAHYLRREFNAFVGAVAAALLATSAMWLAYSHVAVTDIPLAVFFAAAVLLLMPVVEGRPGRPLAAAVLLALAVLAKGLVPLVLMLPLLPMGWKHRRLWLRVPVMAVFCAVTLPWYALCYLRNGPQFIQVFFWQHQLGRFTSPELQHVRPFWFYGPILLGAFFPSVLFFGFVATKRVYHDHRLRYLLVTCIWGFLFFSVSVNKLAGYLLPLLPLLATLAACGMDAARRLWPRALALATALAMCLLPMMILAAGLLPRAITPMGAHQLFPVDLATAGRIAGAVPIAIVAAIASLFLTRERALTLWFGLVCCGWAYVEYAALPWVDRGGSARPVWRELLEPKRQYCVGSVARSWRYGLNYYADIPLRDCAAGETAHSIIQDAGSGTLRTTP